MNKWIKWFEQPYAEEDALLNEWIEMALHRISWKLFEHQDDIVYMANETDNGIPVLKDNAIEVIGKAINSEFGWLRVYMINRILISYAKSNIDLGEEAKWYLNEQFDPEDAEDFWNGIYQYIWNDYSKALGDEKTAELWKKWGYPSLKEE